MDDRFFNGVIGCSTKVCGYHLDALTPWHHVLLSAVDSSVLDPAQTTTPDDLLIFIKIAQVQWPETPDLRPTFRDRLWHRRLKKVKTLKRELARFKEWLDVQFSNPKLWQDDNSSGGSMSSPGMFMLVVGIVSAGGLSLSEAWNMRSAEAQWFNTTLAELKGAKIKIAYDNEDLPPPLDLEETEILEVARKQLSPQAFAQFKKARAKNKKK